MSRPHRPLAVKTMYHVGTGGNAGEAVFRDPLDRQLFLEKLERAVWKYSVECHAYCLMSTHYHLLVRTTEENNLDDFMWSINCLYAKTFNKRYVRTGHLFERRYFADPVLDDAYLLECARYIFLNPVRAGICRRPDEWPWSSFRATCGLEPVPDFLTVDWLLAPFGSDPVRARRRLADFVMAGIAKAA